MGINDYMGALGGLLGQQAVSNQWAQLQNAGTGGTWNTNTSSYVVNVAPVEAVAPKAPHAETAVEWLDRRVSEICLAL